MSRLVEYSEMKFALGSDVSLTLVTGQPAANVAQLFSAIWLEIFQFERQFSRFLPASELSAFNRSAGVKTAVSMEFWKLLSAAKELAIESDNIFNPFILPALQRAGYSKSFTPEYNADILDDHSNKSVVSADRLQLSDGWAMIPYGTAIELGGCGKGYLADYIADNFIPDWISGYWLSFGGDIVGQGHDADNEYWNVLVDNTTSSDESFYIPTYGHRFAVATSSTGVIKGDSNGKAWHHILDPRTGTPANSDISQATVLHESAVKADVLASTAIILGSSLAKDYLVDHGATAAVLQGAGYSNLFGAVEKIKETNYSNEKVLINA